MLDNLNSAMAATAMLRVSDAKDWVLLATLAALAATLVFGFLAARQRSRLLLRIEQGLDRFSNADFTPAIEDSVAEPLVSLVRRFNALGAVLRERQRSDEHSELLLRTLIDAAPMAIVLMVDTGEIEYANETARELFSEGRDLGGANFMSLLSEAQAPFRDAVLDVNDRLFTVDVEGAPETYHLSKRHFDLHGNTHTLLMVKHLTRELRRQEIVVWKRLIRVLNHELNNSLAPISSLAHSGQLMARSPPDSEMLGRVFSTIEERARHLAGFIEGYSQFAKLPQPRLAPVVWEVLLERLRSVVPFTRVGTPPGRHASFDTAQIEQALINLLKNARESGSGGDDIELEVHATAQGFAIEVRDRGPGFTQAALENALVPFYSTKETGTGLGLTLCREIVEAHGGRLRIANRNDGGAVVTLWLPDVS